MWDTSFACNICGYWPLNEGGGCRIHGRMLLKVHYNETGNYVSRDTERRARNSCCRGKAISIIYSECVPVALFIQHTYIAHASYYVVICGLSGCTVFLHLAS